jgi:hypothetical protein
MVEAMQRTANGLVVVGSGGAEKVHNQLKHSKNLSQPVNGLET